MELRSEDSPDIQAYTHKRTVDKIVVPVGEDIAKIKTQFLKVQCRFKLIRNDKGVHGRQVAGEDVHPWRQES